MNDDAAKQCKERGRHEEKNHSHTRKLIRLHEGLLYRYHFILKRRIKSTAMDLLNDRKPFQEIKFVQKLEKISMTRNISSILKTNL